MKANELCVRVIPCLDCRDGRVVKGIQFQGLQDAGEPAELAKRYEDEGADEIVLLDISATLETRKHKLSTLRRVRSMLSIPLTVGGGVQSMLDVEALLDAGADKVSINTAAVRNPELLTQISETFGCQCTVIAIDASLKSEKSWEIYVRSGTEAIASLDAIDWAKMAVNKGAGEILLTSRDRDGSKTGYDLELLEAVCSEVRVPVVASGGANSAQDFIAAAKKGASGLLAASIFHYSESSIQEIKIALRNEGIKVRL